ncbi:MULTISPECIES: hypothetical protein [unclassified Pseudomonas]|uniref:hypothetical protein n=1 Tax=unclassified Pseudomonas TaxID=196821 RepID=UPI000595D339|nr:MULTISPECIES: hypothetical protein [unclassified Pseudomonas]MBD0684777.1 hypothetical protein [Pseudomonas sp. PSB18]
MPHATLNLILNTLNETGLGPLASRPYDCAFNVLAAPPEQKRLIVMGFNGSEADKDFTNLSAIEGDFQQPGVCNVELGVKGKWGSTRLANQLSTLPEKLGFTKAETLYTNALLLCFKDAASIGRAARASALGSHQVLAERSMRFFAEATMKLSRPELIVAYSNSLLAPSAASILYGAFGQGEVINHLCTGSHTATFGFTATIAGVRVPVVGIRHMSRFTARPELIHEAWKRQLARI